MAVKPITPAVESRLSRMRFTSDLMLAIADSDDHYRSINPKNELIRSAEDVKFLLDLIGYPDGESHMIAAQPQKE